MNDNATDLSPEPVSMTENDDLMGMIFSVTPSAYSDQDLGSPHYNFDTEHENDCSPANPNIQQNNFEHDTFLQPNVASIHTQSSGDFQHQTLDNPSEQNPALAINTLFQDSHGIYVAQSDDLIAKRPEFNGDTQTLNVFIPLLPLAKNHNVSNRQLIMDTETTGFEATGGDRIIEIGIVELINRKPTGEKLHVYINPNKEMDEDVIRVHGITNAFLADKPTFEQIGQAVYDFMLGAELVAHNAPFDMSFLVAEFNRLGLTEFANLVTVTDSLVIAKQQYAGQRNTLDALVKRLNVGKQDRTFHGALLDAEILAEVYLAMTGGQVSLGIDDSIGGILGTGEHQHFSMPVARFLADTATEQAHLAWITDLKDQHPALLERWKAATDDKPQFNID